MKERAASKYDRTLFTLLSGVPIATSSLLLEPFIHLVAILLTLRTGVRQGVYQPQLIGTLGTGRLDLIDQLLHLHYVIPLMMDDDEFTVNSVIFPVGSSLYQLSSVCESPKNIRHTSREAYSSGMDVDALTV